MSLLSLLLVGFLLGMKHATEADHLAAVATLAAGRQSLGQTIRQGVAWGVGHTVTLTAFGGVVILLGTAIPPALERSLEMAVGLMLIALGLDVLRRLVHNKVHFHVHQQITNLHHVHANSHPHGGTPVQTSNCSLAHSRGLPFRALAVGMMHGLAGTAALILLSLEAVQSVPMGMAYIALFGVGSIIGMGVLSMVIAIPLRLSVNRQAWLHGGLSAVFALFSCVLGASIVYEIGFVEGLLV